jgi:H/ACA ribonucleoprotein complex non-core subunit NAF1
MSGRAYDEHGPYDVDYSSLTAPPPPSRPIPSAYDDPYAESYNSPVVTEPEGPPRSDVPRASSSSIDHDRPSRGRRRGNRGRGHGDRGQRGRGRARRYPISPTPSIPPDQSASHTALHLEEYSPLYPAQDMRRTIPSQNLYPMYQVSQSQDYLPQYGVQPHINPRFASAFGLSMYPSPSLAPQGYSGSQGYPGPPGFSQGQYGTSANWSDEWNGPMQDRSSTSRSGASR